MKIIDVTAIAKKYEYIYKFYLALFSCAILHILTSINSFIAMNFFEFCFLVFFCVVAWFYGTSISRIYFIAHPLNGIITICVTVYYLSIAIYGYYALEFAFPQIRFNVDRSHEFIAMAVTGFCFF